VVKSNANGPIGASFRFNHNARRRLWFGDPLSIVIIEAGGYQEWSRGLMKSSITDPDWLKIQEMTEAFMKYLHERFAAKHPDLL
jgi:hypothetical protein